MLQSTRETLQTLLPHLDDGEFAAACERFDRYIRLTAEIARTANADPDPTLTATPSRVSVSPGKVDPKRTFKNTG